MQRYKNTLILPNYVGNNSLIFNKLCSFLHQNATFRSVRVLNLLNQDFLFVRFGGQKDEIYLCSTFNSFIRATI